jgi:hypothetical protein
VKVYFTHFYISPFFPPDKKTARYPCGRARFCKRKYVQAKNTAAANVCHHKARGRTVAMFWGKATPALCSKSGLQPARRTQRRITGGVAAVALPHMEN